MSAAAGTVIATSKQIAGDVAAAKTNAATNAYLASLGSETERAEFLAKTPEAQREILSKRDDYNDAQKWTTGGSYSRALDAVTTAIVGSVAGQGGGQVAANALAPYAAHFIGGQFDPNHGDNPDATLQLISHAVLGALLAEANGTNAGGGAVAGAGGELAAKFIVDQLYQGDVGGLSEQDKQMVVALSQAVGALAGGMGGDGLAGAASGANITRNSLENNYLSAKDVKILSEKLKSCDADDDACRNAVVQEAKVRSASNNAKLLSCDTLDCVNALIPEIFGGARAFGDIYEADAAERNVDKLAFGAISDVETYGLLLAANMSAGLPKYADGSISKDAFVEAVKALSYTKGVPGTFFQKQFDKYEALAGSTKQPHEYETTSIACAMSYASSCGNVIEQFDALRRFAGPGTDGKGLAGNGVVSYLSIMGLSLGYVTHLIDPSTSSLINITVPGAHALDPGFVIRQVLPDGYGGFSVSTRGWGTGSSPLRNSNSWADDFVWAPNTRDIGAQVDKLQWPWSDFPSKQRCMNTRDSQGKLIEVCQ